MTERIRFSSGASPVGAPRKRLGFSLRELVCFPVAGAAELEDLGRALFAGGPVHHRERGAHVGADKSKREQTGERIASSVGHKRDFVAAMKAVARWEATTTTAAFAAFKAG